MHMQDETAKRKDVHKYHEVDILGPAEVGGGLSVWLQQGGVSVYMYYLVVVRQSSL